MNECADAGSVDYAKALRDLWSDYRGDGFAYAVFRSDELPDELDFEERAYIGDFGKTLPARYILWLEGLRIARAQLESVEAPRA